MLAVGCRPPAAPAPVEPTEATKTQDHTGQTHENHTGLSRENEDPGQRPSVSVGAAQAERLLVAEAVLRWLALNSGRSVKTAAALCVTVSEAPAPQWLMLRLQRQQPPMHSGCGGGQGRVLLDVSHIEFDGTEQATARGMFYVGPWNGEGSAFTLTRAASGWAVRDVELMWII